MLTQHTEKKLAIHVLLQGSSFGQGGLKVEILQGGDGITLHNLVGTVSHKLDYLRNDLIILVELLEVKAKVVDHAKRHQLHLLCQVCLLCLLSAAEQELFADAIDEVNTLGREGLTQDLLLCKFGSTQ